MKKCKGQVMSCLVVIRLAVNHNLRDGRAAIQKFC